MPTQVAEGVVRLGTDIVNWYLVADESGVTIVDAAVRGYRPQLDDGLKLLGRTSGDVRAVVLTHAHADHVGCAEMLRTELGIPVYVHERDRDLATTAKAFGKNEASLLPYLRHGAAWKLLTGLARGGGLKPVRIGEVTTFAGDETLELPGQPHVVETPGHTPGHVAFHFADHGVLAVGDLMCSWNPLTGRRGPQLLPRALNQSTPQMLESLGRVDELEASVTLFGHGDPWRDTPRAAADSARRIGPT
jgi:glyoxylase-like metal-dependent hydrolase (beta-lactamase superfamily II)